MRNFEQAIPTYDKALVINVDVQNDFAKPDGALAVPDGEAVIGPLNRLNRWARERGGTIVFTGDQHPTVTTHFHKWPVHCVVGTPGAMLHKDLEVMPDDTIAIKGTLGSGDDGYSGLEAEPVTGPITVWNARSATYNIGEMIIDAETAVEKRDRRLAVMIGGLATDYCVRATTLDALAVTDRDITDIYLLDDAVRAVNLQPDDGERAIAEMRKAGAITLSAALITMGAIDLEHTANGEV